MYSDEVDDNDSSVALIHQSRQKAGRSQWLQVTCAFLTLYAIFTTIVIGMVRKEGIIGGKAQGAELTKMPSVLLADFPANIRYKEQLNAGNVWQSSPFSGQPSDAVDQAWQDLMYADRISTHQGPLHAVQITPPEALRLGIGYSYPALESNLSVVLGVTHNLHCLRRMRQYFFRDYYYTDASQHFLAEETGHLVHCVEALRHSIVCNADLAMLPFQKPAEGEGPVKELHLLAAPVQTCTDWDSLNDILRTRLGAVKILQ